MRNHGLQSFKWTWGAVDYPEVLAAAQSAIDSAQQKWNDAFIARGSSIRIGPEYPVTSTTVQIHIVRLDDPNNAYVSNDGKHIVFDDRSFRSGVAAGFKSAVALHEFGHKLGFDQQATTGCSSLSVMHDTTPGSFRSSFSPCDLAKLNSLIGNPIGGGGGGNPGQWIVPPHPVCTEMQRENELDQYTQAWCQQLCSNQAPPISTVCFGAILSGDQICEQKFPNQCNRSRLMGADFEVYGDAYSGVPLPGPMWIHSSVRQCSNWSWQNSVYKSNSTLCLLHCEANGADACEYDYANQQCYVEFGSGCQVEFGFTGWAAYVLSGGGTGGDGRWKDDGNGGCYYDPTDEGPDQCTPSGGGGNMAQNSAVRGCSNYSELPPVYKADAAACSSYCQSQDADACEWASGNGDCYAEFGDGCYVEGGYGGWWAQVFSTPPTGSLVMAALYSAAQSDSFLATLAGTIAMLALVVCGAIVAVGRRNGGLAVPAR